MFIERLRHSNFINSKTQSINSICILKYYLNSIDIFGSRQEIKLSKWIVSDHIIFDGSNFKKIYMENDWTIDCKH